MTNKEWMLTEEELDDCCCKWPDYEGFIAQTQARKLVEWQGQACDMHHSQWPFLVWRSECDECLEQLRQDVGLK